MSKFFNFLEKYENLKKPIQWFFYVFIVAATISSTIGIIFGVKSCKFNDTIETVEAKYFMNETVKVHNNFDVKVYYAKTVKSISYQKEKNSTEKTTLVGNYIKVNLDITKNIDSGEKDHKFRY